MNVYCIGDAMITGKNIAEAAQELHIKPIKIEIDDWETDWNRL